MRVLLVLLPLLFSLACNKHVFEIKERECVTEDRVVEDVDLGGPIDILFVVDDSGSMAEEQEALADGFYRDTCPFLTDAVPFVPENEKNPTDARLAELAELCGFVQIIGAFERDFQVGLITTTVDECDNRYGQAPAEWGRRPRRGCLMPSADGTKVFAQADDQLQRRFREALESVGTYGSAFERGLDAAQIFFDEDALRAPSCEGDLGAFLRPEADLAVVFLTDEDDCSRDGPLAGQDTLTDETPFRSCDIVAGTAPEPEEIELSPAACYDPQAALADVTHYATMLRTRKPPGREVRVAVIGGATGEGDTLAAAGCRPDPSGPVGGCYASGGQTASPQICGPDARPGEPPCCLADGAHRYFQLADALGGLFTGGSLCAPFAQTLMEVAAFFGRTDGVRLTEEPQNPAAVRVRVTRRDGSEEVLRPLGDMPDPSTDDGWYFESPTQITFIGPSAPQPGDRIDVAVLADSERDSCVSPTGPAG
jgi:hypothetical protein